MGYKSILFEMENHVVIITFNRPKVLNALNTEVILELKDAINRCQEDENVKVVILTGAGEKAFVVGQDINELKELLKNGSSEKFMKSEKLGQDTFRLVETMAKPVIAAVNGFALGGGLEICMACDIRFASEKAHFGQPEILLGALPGWGGTQRLARLIGTGRAKELIISGEQITAQRAYEMGLVNRVFPAEELMEETKKFAQKLTTLPPITIKMDKHAINYGYDMALDDATSLELLCSCQCFNTQDMKEGMTAFLEKRKPNFIGK